MQRIVQSSTQRGNAYYRLSACVVAAIVLLCGKWLGYGVISGAWPTLLVLSALIVLSILVLPLQKPRTDVLRSFFDWIARGRTLSLAGQLSISASFLVGAVGACYVLENYMLGRGFNIFLIAIYLSAILLELRVAVFTWIASIPLAYYETATGLQSTRLERLADFPDIFVFTYMGLGMILVATLLYGSSYHVVSQENIEGQII